MTKKAAIYGRVSTKGQADFGTSLDTQEQRTREYAAKAGYEIVEALVIFEDFTGTDLNRPGINLFKQAALAGQFDRLLIPTFDRLYRPENEGDEWKALELMAFFNENGVKVEFVDGSVPNDPRYAAVASIFAGMNSGDYRRKMLEATQLGRNARKAEGRFLSRPPFGYSRDEEMFLIVDEEQAQVVKMIFDLCDRERMGLRLIQKRLIGRVESPSGGLVWHVEGLRRLLTNVVYWSGHHRSGVPAPTIISQEQAKRVQSRLKANHRLKTGSKTRWALQGRIRCTCGSTWKCQSGRGGRAREEYFCKNRYADGPQVLRGGDRCNAPRLGKHDLELAVFIALHDAFQDPSHLAAALEVALKGMRERIELFEVEIGPLKTAIDEMDEKLLEVDRARIRRRIPTAELDANEKEFLELKAELEQRLSEMDPVRIADLEEAKAMLPAIGNMLGWSETWAPRPLKNTGGFNFFKPGGIPPISDNPEVDELAKLWALAPPDWWIGDVTKFEDGEWAQRMLTELLDRLHATIVVDGDDVVLEGVLPITVPLEPDAPSNSLYASRDPRRGS